MTASSLDTQPVRERDDEAGVEFWRLGKVALPVGEDHLVEWMTRSKHARIVEGWHTYQMNKIEALMRHVPAGARGLAVDVGGHVGLWSMWLAEWFRQVAAFEPHPLHQKLWHLNVGARLAELDRYSDLDNRVRCYGVALGSVAGRARLYSPPGESSGNTHISTEKGIDVLVAVFDHLRIQDLAMRHHRVDVVKIDTEGYELKVLRGMTQVLKFDRPVIVVEQKGYEATYHGGEKREAVTYLQREHSYRVVEEISGDYIMVGG